MKPYVWRALMWFIGLSIGFIIVGFLIQDINPPLYIVRWLIYRRGYPYFQAIFFSMFVVTVAIVLRNFFMELAEGEETPFYVNIFLNLLPHISTEQKKDPVWIILLIFSVVAFFISLYFPKCLKSNSILVSFDIFQNGQLIAHLSPSETIFLDPGTFVDIEAKFEASLLNLEHFPMNCKWASFTGDGRLLEVSNCKINYQSGIDKNPDPVAVTITQKRCDLSFGNEHFFVNTP